MYVDVKVFPFPEINISGRTKLCIGDSTALFVSGATEYFWNNGENDSAIKIAPVKSTYYSVGGFNKGNCYTEKLIFVEVENCDTINSPINNGINIYPNPTKGIITLESAEDVQLIIYDTKGAIVFISDYNKGITSVDISPLNLGLYFLRTTTKGMVKYIQLIKSQ